MNKALEFHKKTNIHSIKKVKNLIFITNLETIPNNP